MKLFKTEPHPPKSAILGNVSDLKTIFLDFLGIKKGGLQLEWSF